MSEVAQSCPTLCDPVDCSLPTRLLPPCDSPGKSTGVGCHFLLQGIFPTQADALTFEPQGKQCGRFWFNSWVKKIPWKRDRLTSPVFLGFLSGSDGKESTCNVGDLGSIPGFGRCPAEGHGYALQYSCLKNFHGQRSLEGYSLWGCKESYVTEQLSTAQYSTITSS